jgi:hypothetical protein
MAGAKGSRTPSTPLLRATRMWGLASYTLIGLGIITAIIASARAVAFWVGISLLLAGAVSLLVRAVILIIVVLLTRRSARSTSSTTPRLGAHSLSTAENPGRGLVLVPGLAADNRSSRYVMARARPVSGLLLGARSRLRRKLVVIRTARADHSRVGLVSGWLCSQSWLLRAPATRTMSRQELRAAEGTCRITVTREYP